jgi:putative PIN family toxin of toxin-antitoxin system
LRLVFDTNVYVSMFGVPGSKADLAFRLAVRGMFELVVSPEILKETRDKLAGPKFVFSDVQLDRAERLIREVATVVEPELELAVLEDEPDNRVLECAFAAGAAAIVTGDKELLSLKDYEGIGIMTVAGRLYTFPEGES